MFFSLEGKVAVVTGASSGIGKATAERYAKAGAKVVFADIQDGEQFAKECDGIFVRVDVTQEDQVKMLMETAVKKYGHLNIAVNNAGIGVGADITDVTEEVFDQHHAVNSKGVLFGIKHAAANMSDGGSIINTSSMAGLLGFPSYGAYAASKAAVIAMTRNAALELAPRAIRVNAICPGTIDTPINETETGEVELALTRHLTPLGRIGKPEEIAALYHYLASDESAFMTGLAIPFDGGLGVGISLGIIEPMLEIIGGQ